MHSIRRATKSDPHAKDDLDTLKQQVIKLRETLATATSEYERRLAEMSYDFNRRISATNAEFDKLAALVQRFVAPHADPSVAAISALTEFSGRATSSAAARAAAPAPVPHHLLSLSHIAAAASLQSQTALPVRPPAPASAVPAGAKRKAEEGNGMQQESVRQRLA